MKKIYLVVGFATLLLFLAGCRDLAGNPEIVRTLPTPLPSQGQAVSQTAPDVVPNIELGAQLFANRCTSCHGVAGAGDGELVASGQITGIPNFADAAQHANNTPEDYYDVITNGRIENLMPPFSGSLNDEERWALANYVMTLADDNPLIVPVNMDVASVVDETTSGETPNADTTSEVVGNDGVISGVVTHDSGGTIPENATVTLHVMDMSNQEQTFDAVIGADGSYRFDNVPVVTNAGYYVTMAYGDGFFNSRFVAIDPENPALNLDIALYNTTDDATVISISMVLTQIDRLSDDSVRVVQLVRVTNQSEALFVYDDADGYNVSVAIPLPENALPAADNDFSRYYYNETTNTMYDTQPVIPGEDHDIQVVFNMPMSNALTFEQQFPYAFTGPFEAYVDDSVLALNAENWFEVGTQTVNGILYNGVSLVDGQPANSSIQFEVRNKTPFVDSWLSYLMLGIGVSLLAFALVMFYINYLRNGTPQARIDNLTRQIADLDSQYDQKTISKTQYDKQRNALKTELSDLMNTLE